MKNRFLSKIFILTISFLFTASVLAATERPSSASAAEQLVAGQRYFSNGRFEDALAAWNIALDGYRQGDDRSGQARVLQHKAEAYLAIGQYYKAISNLRSALALAEAAGNDLQHGAPQ